MRKHLPRLAGLAGLAVALAAATTLLSGCMKVGPDYQKPKTEVPKGWEIPKDPAVAPGQARVRAWWKVFKDPLLTELINRAAQTNLDLKTAVAKVEEARQQIGVTASEELPQIDGTGSYNKYAYSHNDPSGAGANYSVNNYGLSASWEIDLFGRIARSVEAARADYQASIEDRSDVMVSMFSEVARAYLTVRTNQAKLSATLGNIRSQQEVLKLTRVRFENGLATGLDVSQAESVLASSQAQIPPLRDGLNQAINTLCQLLALPPGALGAKLRKPRPIPNPPPSVAVGLPADLLRRRPDIRRAERQLAAATARIGVATAALYPSFSLSGTLGIAAGAGGNLLRADSLYYTVSPGLSLSIFHGGALRSQIKVRDAQTEQALYTYEQTVIKALNETDNALNSYVYELDRLQALRRTVAAQRRNLYLAVKLYKEGLKDFQSVLDAQRQLFDYDNQLAQSRGDASTYLVQLYKALGGGWTPPQPAGKKPSQRPQG